MTLAISQAPAIAPVVSSQPTQSQPSSEQQHHSLHNLKMQWTIGADAKLVCQWVLD